MLLIKKPSEEYIFKFIAEQRALPFSYKEVGLTEKAQSPSGFGVDHVREVLGHGEAIFNQAVEALEKWQQFEIGWVSIYPKDALINPGVIVSPLAWHGIVWTLNSCRIIYVIDKDGPVKRFGFGYGTLPEHAEIGEERFLVEWHKASDEVTYDIFAFSNPSQIWGWILYPAVRFVQNLFRRDSIKVMRKQVQNKLFAKKAQP